MTGKFRWRLLARTWVDKLVKSEPQAASVAIEPKWKQNYESYDPEDHGSAWPLQSKDRDWIADRSRECCEAVVEIDGT